MSTITVEYFHVQCDTPECKEGTPDFKDLDEAQEYLDAEGWHVTKDDDTCPTCYAKVKAIFAEVGNGITD